MKALKYILIILAGLVAIALVIFVVLFMIVNFGGIEKRVIGTAQSTNSNHEIEVIYRNDGGSYAPNKGGIHVDVYLIKKGIFRTKTDITHLVGGVIPCSSSFGTCSINFTDGDTSTCTVKEWTNDDGSQGCVSKDLEDFEIKEGKLYWYGEVFEL